MDNKQIRQDARYLLKGHWLKLSLIYLIFSIFIHFVEQAPTILESSSAIFTLVMAISGLILSIFIIPFAYGVIYTMVKAIKGEKVRLFEFVSIGLKNFKNAYFLVFGVIINLAVQIVAFVASALLLNYGYEHSSSFLIVTGGIIYLITVFFLFAKFFYYTLGMFVMIDNENSGIQKILNESKEIMSLERVNLLKLIISFFGWFLLMLTVAIIAAILKLPSDITTLITYLGFALLFPYFQISMYVFYKYHKDQHYKYEYEEHMKEKESGKQNKKEKSNTDKKEKELNKENKKKKK